MRKKKPKPFDAVAMMRAIRDRLSQEVAGMSVAEQQAYIRQRLKGKRAPVPRARRPVQTA